MRISGSPRTTADVVSSLHRAFADGNLVVASERVNPNARENILRLAPGWHESRNFAVTRLHGKAVVLHKFAPDEIDNDLAEYVATELVRSGGLDLRNTFERCFAGVVVSSFEDDDVAWSTFYHNTLQGLERVMAGDYDEDDFSPVTVFGRIYSHARDLLCGSSLLDVGTCFGFFPITLKELKEKSPHLDVSALDVSAPILDLAKAASDRSPVTSDIRFVTGDGRDLPFADESFDTVSSLHVLEHLSSPDARLVVEEMCRVSCRRVVVAVPLEEKADAAFDHARSFDRESLLELGVGIGGWECHYEEFLGGWMILDRKGKSLLDSGLFDGYAHWAASPKKGGVQ